MGKNRLSSSNNAIRVLTDDNSFLASTLKFGGSAKLSQSLLDNSLDIDIIPDLCKPYSVNSATVNSGGYADFMTKENDSELSFNVGTAGAVTIPVNVPAMTSNSQDGFVLTSSHAALPTAPLWHGFDRSNTTASIIGATGTLWTNISLGGGKRLKNIKYYQTPAGVLNDIGQGTITGSKDGGSTYPDTLYTINETVSGDYTLIADLDITSLDLYTDIRVTSTSVIGPGSSYGCGIGDLEIEYYADVTNDPMLVTFPNGNTYAIIDIPNITGLTADGTYNVSLKESDLTLTAGNISIGGVSYRRYTAMATAAINTITEAYIRPTAPASGDLNLRLDRCPYVPEEYTTDWAEVQFVKLGEVTKTTGVLGTPISYALNGKSTIKLAVAKQTTTNFYHNLGTTDYELSGQYMEIGGVVTGLIAGSGGYELHAGQANGGYGTNHVRRVSRLYLEFIGSLYYVYNSNASGTKYFSTANLILYFTRRF